MFKRKVSLFLMVVFLVGMMAVTAYAAGFSLSFDFVNDTDRTDTVTKNAASTTPVTITTMSGSLNSVKLELINASTGSPSKATTVSKIGTYTFGSVNPGGYYLKGTAISGYGYLSGIWTP